MVSKDELEAAISAGASVGRAIRAAEQRDQSDVFGLYVAAVRRAMLATENPTARNVERATAALDTCTEVLQVSSTTNDGRRAAALSTLALLRHEVTDALAARPTR